MPPAETLVVPPSDVPFGDVEMMYHVSPRTEELSDDTPRIEELPDDYEEPSTTNTGARRGDTPVAVAVESESAAPRIEELPNDYKEPSTTVDTGVRKDDKCTVSKSESTAEQPAAKDDSVHVQAGMVQPKKKKNKKGKGGIARMTGFEEYAAEGPITAEQVEEELALYSPLKPFSERIEICVQKYRAKRKWDEWRHKVFSMYLSVGGISAGPKMFVGMDPKRMKDMDTEEIQKMVATDYVQRPEDNPDWEVDFVYVVRGMLSYRVPYVMCFNSNEKLNLACQLIKNFLNYILYHNVCPEFADSVREAAALCDMAERELIICRMVSDALPGKLHMALSTLNGGHYSGMVREDFGGEKRWDADIRTMRTAGMSKDQARQVLRSAIRQVGSKKERDEGLLAFVSEWKYMSLEVVEIVFPEESEEEAKSLGGNFDGLDRLGKLVLKEWVPEDINELPQPENPRIVEIWLEKSIIQLCFPKMHLECKVHWLNTGMQFIDTITGVMCSFYLKLDPPEPADVPPDDDGDVAAAGNEKEKVNDKQKKPVVVAQEKTKELVVEEKDEFIEL